MQSFVSETSRRDVPDARVASISPGVPIGVRLIRGSGRAGSCRRRRRPRRRPRRPDRGCRRTGSCRSGRRARRHRCRMAPRRCRSRRRPRIRRRPRRSGPGCAPGGSCPRRCRRRRHRGPGTGHNAQASPTPLESASAWSGLDTVGQLSQKSPTPSPSPSRCVGVEVEAAVDDRDPLGLAHGPAGGHQRLGPGHGIHPDDGTAPRP